MTSGVCETFYEARRYAELMSTKRVRPLQPTRPAASRGTPIMIIPEQTAKAIESRVKIRESLHDSRAITVRADGRNRRRR
jgi:hypothetical protein